MNGKQKKPTGLLEKLSIIFQAIAAIAALIAAIRWW